jgi:hypothetical protein
MNCIDRRLGHDVFVEGRSGEMGAASLSKELEENPGNWPGRNHVI